MHHRKQKLIMISAFFLILIVCVSCTTGTVGTEGSTSPMEPAPAYELYDAQQWKAEGSLNDRHGLIMRFQNPWKDTFTTFSLNDWSADFWYICQKKVGDTWVDLGIAYPRAAAKLPNSIYLNPGEEVEIAVALSDWIPAFQEGEEGRFLIGVSIGELEPADVQQKPRAYIPFEFTY